MNIYSPCFYSELENILKNVSQINELCAVRYPRGCQAQDLTMDIPDEDFTVFDNESHTVIISYGVEFAQVYRAQEELKNKGKNIDIIKLNKIYPLSDALVEIVKKYNTVYFFEESIESGSVSEHLAAKLLNCGFKGNYKAITIDDVFVSADEYINTLKKYNLDAQSIINMME